MRISLLRLQQPLLSNLLKSPALQQLDLSEQLLRRPRPMSIRDLLTKRTREEDFSFLRIELPVRLAHLVAEGKLLLASKRDIKCEEVTEGYQRSFRDLLRFYKMDDKDTDGVILDEFDATLAEIKSRHLDTLPMMAEAASFYLARNPEDQETIQFFLERLYTSRIGLFMLINQHMSSNKDDNSNLVGLADPECDVLQAVAQAFHCASRLAEDKYGCTPRLNFKVVNETGSVAAVTVPYFPSYLYHICFELMKNALRATCENHSGQILPPVRIGVSKLENGDVVVTISDQGAGIAQELLGEEIFRFGYSTAELPDLANPCPMAGLGYGLPMSRLYARYLNGDLELSSSPDCGCCVMLTLKSESVERLPMLNETVARFYLG